MVGYYNNQLIGLTICMINSVDSSQATLNVVVHPNYRRIGFGSSLYNKIIEYAKGQQIKTVETYVKKRIEDAVGFAERRSFQVVLYSWKMELDLEEINFTNEVKEDIIFRKATIADGKYHARVIHECFGDKIEENSLGQLLKDPSVSVYMLENKEEIIGSTTMQLRENLTFMDYSL